MRTNPSSTAAVIGSGFGGLASAIRLQAKGYQTTIFEMRDQPGGRAYVYRDKGFTYDAGPTIITAPFLIDELFELAGKKTADYLRMVPCDPFYRIVFHDGMTFNYNGDEEQMLREVARIAPDDVAGYQKLVKKTREIFQKAFIELADQPFTHFTDMLKVAPDLIRLRSDQSVYAQASRYVKSERLRQILSFHPLLVGGHPFASSSIYAMIMYLERKWGVHFAMGGTGALVRSLVKLFEEMGGTVRLNARVEEIEIENGKVGGLRLKGGERFAAHTVVSNADVANTYRKLVAPVHRRKWTDKRLAGMKYSMGLFLIYFGTNRTYPELAHHTIVLTQRYKPLLDDIFYRKVLAKDFSLYLHAPTRTDASLAPEGHECFYVLSPVPHLDGHIDWDNVKERYADAILESLETLIPDLRKHLVSKLIMTPKDFETDLDAYKGSAFQFEPVLTQSAWFRPHNVSEDVKGLYFACAGTHPGAGLPGVLSSAKVLERVIPRAPA
ncbi:MAG: phytoene desaturase [Candidatus Methylacidiphilales bacterium]|nr:phytoene desaturase [Candidatus Methylacidiphilales bacterium]